MEYSSVPLEVKDMSREKRTILFAHANYGNIDRGNDISDRGMFTKSWTENPTPDFLFNHKTEQILGKTLRVYDDENKAYTDAKFGKWKQADDVMEMADEGVLRGASFGYVTQSKKEDTVNGKKVRRLKQVYHGESSLLTTYPMNPLAGVISLTKEADLQLLVEMKASVNKLESYCRKANASDETIIMLLKEIEEQKNILSKYDTSAIQVATGQGDSRNDSFRKQLLLLNAKMN